MTKDELRDLIRQHLHDDGAAIESLWSVIVEFVAEWLEDGGGGTISRDYKYRVAEVWREEMVE